MSEQRVKELKEGDSVESCYAVKWVQLYQKKNGESYLRFVFTDKTGEITAICWNYRKEYKDIKVDCVCEIKGSVGKYNDKLQITLSSVNIVDDEDIDFSLFVKTSAIDTDTLGKGIDEILSMVKTDYLSNLLSSFFNDASFRKKFLTHPAAKSVHHAWSGGLAEHTIGVSNVCRHLAGQYELNSYLLITGALLHDIGKVRELKNGLTPSYTDEGRLVGHIIIGANMIEEKIAGIEGFPPDAWRELKHAILSHHGELEFGSPVRPMTLEALVLHYADNIDAKTSAFKNWIKAKPDMSDPKWSQFWPMMDRFIYKNSDSE